MPICFLDDCSGWSFVRPWKFPFLCSCGLPMDFSPTRLSTCW